MSHGTSSSHLDAPGARSEVLFAENLQKSYGAHLALRGLSLSLQAGRVLGFLGPNGAGKTTAIRILTTILEPSAGRFIVDGIGSDRPHEIRRRIGVLPETLGFPKTNTALEHLTYFARLHGRGARDARRRATALLDEVGLAQRGRSLIGTYSRGMRQRLGIARTLINDPAVVFLDEPTLGLDPRGQKELLDLVRRIPRERKAGIVLCSHLLSEIEGVCDDVVILSTGQVVASGSVNEVIRQAQGAFVERRGIRVHVPADAVDAARKALEALSEVAGVTAEEGSSWLDVEVVGGGDLNALQDPHVNNRILEALIRADIPVLGFQATVGRLNEAFLHLTEQAIR
jgi:ABC-2 type transport system ATP-binding protein